MAEPALKPGIPGGLEHVPLPGLQEPGDCTALRKQRERGRGTMWYVIQTFGGQEERTAGMIRKLVVPGCLEECFVPRRERLKKFGGCWNKVEEVLFGGYVFVISHRPGQLYEELKRIPRLSRLLGREEDCFFPLGERDERLVRGIGGRKHHTPLSRIVLEEGKKIHVIEGPLKDYVGNVVKVNPHKREVVVQVEFMGRPVELFMGVEMVRPGGGG